VPVCRRDAAFQQSGLGHQHGSAADRRPVEPSATSHDHRVGAAQASLDDDPGTVTAPNFAGPLRPDHGHLERRALGSGQSQNLERSEGVELVVPVEDHDLDSHTFRIDERYQVELCTPEPGPTLTTSGFSIVVDSGLDALSTADTVIVPGFAERPIPATALVALRAAHDRGAPRRTFDCISAGPTRPPPPPTAPPSPRVVVP
jgi:hypothetical protein